MTSQYQYIYVNFYLKLVVSLWIIHSELELIRTSGLILLGLVSGQQW